MNGPRPPRRRREPHRLAAWTGVVLVVLATAWAAGLFWFAGTIPTDVADPEEATDAIVVLTGGQGRLSEGLDLLDQGRARLMFVSGVYRGVDVKSLLNASRNGAEILETRIGIGDAVNTAGNAYETAEWVRIHEVRSIRLVTGSYHMPRSLLEFRRAMPDVTVIPHPVFSHNVKIDRWWAWPGTLTLVAGEYTKYLMAAAGLSAVFARPGEGLDDPGTQEITR